MRHETFLPRTCRPAFALYVLLVVLLAAVAPSRARAQNNLSGFNRERARDILEAVKADIKKNYYDQGYHGVDLDARFKAADERLKQATSLGQAWGIIAQVLVDFDDSHTFFVPPSRPARTEKVEGFGENRFTRAPGRGQTWRLGCRPAVVGVAAVE